MKLRAALLGVAVVAGGCASSTEPVLAPGHVALVTAQYPPKAVFNAYAEGVAAHAFETGAKTAAKGAAIGSFPLLAGAQIGPAGAAVGLLIAVPLAAAGAVLGGVGGALEGAATALPADQRNALHVTVDLTRRDAGAQVLVAERVLSATAPATHHTVTYLPQAGPRLDEEALYYRELKDAGFHAVLELTVTAVGFEAGPGDPPSARFSLSLRAQVVPLAADEPAWTREWTHFGEWRALGEWQQSDRGAIERELEEAIAAQAQHVRGLFSTVPQSRDGAPFWRRIRFGRGNQQ